MASLGGSAPGVVDGILSALQHNISLDVEGPPESFFESCCCGTNRRSTTTTTRQQQPQQQQQQQVQQNNVEEELSAAIQEVIGRGNLDNDDAATAAPMVDDDNMPVPENRPQPNEAVGDIFGKWGHSGICAQ